MIEPAVAAKAANPNRRKIDGIFIQDGLHEGAWNMAMDQALLEYGAVTGKAIVRVYGWREPTLSLGYFQNFNDRFSHPSSSSIACVRRRTGGGAIVHDHDVTYSIVLPDSGDTKGHADRLYQTVHGSIVQWLRSKGWDASLVGCPQGKLPNSQSATHESSKCESGERESRDSESLDPESPKTEAKACWQNRGGSESFLCFQRRASLDIVVAGQKIGGSAQRRSRGAILQHGSLLISRSPFAAELEGLGNLPRSLENSGTQMDQASFAIELGCLLGEQIKTSFGVLWLVDADQNPVQDAVLRLSSEYSSAAWTTRN